MHFEHGIDRVLGMEAAYAGTSFMTPEKIDRLIEELSTPVKTGAQSPGTQSS